MAVLPTPAGCPITAAPVILSHTYFVSDLQTVQLMNSSQEQRPVVTWGVLGLKKKIHDLTTNPDRKPDAAEIPIHLFKPSILRKKKNRKSQQVSGKEKQFSSSAPRR